MSLDKNMTDMEIAKHVEESEEVVLNEAERAAEEKKLVRKVDLWLLPCVWVMYLLSYMDVCIPIDLLSSRDRTDRRTANQHRQCESCRHDGRSRHGQ